MHNFSIFMHELDDGRYYLFGYYEYTGTDYRSDMKKLAAEPRNQQWLSVASAWREVLGHDARALDLIPAL
jgi:L-rhamnose mutarotase